MVVANRTFSIFLLHEYPDKIAPKHNKFLNSRKKLCYITFHPPALPVGVSQLMPSLAA